MYGWIPGIHTRVGRGAEHCPISVNLWEERWLSISEISNINKNGRLRMSFSRMGLVDRAMRGRIVDARNSSLWYDALVGGSWYLFGTLMMNWLEFMCVCVAVGVCLQLAF